MEKLVFIPVFVAIAACIAYAATSPHFPAARRAIKAVWGFVQRNLAPVAIGVATVVSFVFASRASLQRRKQSKAIQKSREEQDDNLSQAEVHRAEAKAAAAKADAIIERGRYNLEKVTDEILFDDRVARINERLRNAARASKRTE